MLHGHINIMNQLAMLHILAVLVVIFADVAEVRRKGLNSQGTSDLPTFPLNDDTCHKQTQHKMRVRHRQQIPLRRLVFLRLWGQLKGRGKAVGSFILCSLQGCFVYSVMGLIHSRKRTGETNDINNGSVPLESQ